VTNQTLPFPGAPRPPRRKPVFWLRATPLQRVGVVAAALVLPCCGGAAAIASLGGGKRPVVTTAPAGLTPAPAAERSAGDRVAPSPAGSPSPRTATTREASYPSPRSSAATPPRRRVAASRHPARTVTTRTAIAYPTRTVLDGTLAQGETRLRTAGVTGVRTRTYEIVPAGGVEVARKLIRSVVTRPPVAKVVAVGTKVTPADDGCDPNYTPCVPIADDVDCAGGRGNGPAYVTGPVQVVGDDIYDLDRDGDGIGCQS
jgi:resuscitation-promoting factor RpfB